MTTTVNLDTPLVPWKKLSARPVTEIRRQRLFPIVLVKMTDKKPTK